VYTSTHCNINQKRYQVLAYAGMCACSRDSSRPGRRKPSHRSTCSVWRPPVSCHHHRRRQRCGYDAVWRDTCCSCPDNIGRCRNSRPTTTSDRRLASTPMPRRRSRPRPASATSPAQATSNRCPSCVPAVNRDDVYSWTQLDRVRSSWGRV